MKEPFWTKLLGFLRQILEELLAPPTIAAVSFLEISHAPIDWQELNTYDFVINTQITNLAFLYFSIRLWGSSLEQLRF